MRSFKIVKSDSQEPDSQLIPISHALPHVSGYTVATTVSNGVHRAGFCEHRNEPPGSIIDREYTNCLGDYRFSQEVLCSMDF
jgi:hypothetical protein